MTLSWEGEERLREEKLRDHDEIVRTGERLRLGYVRVHRITSGGLRGRPCSLSDGIQS
jgi:hypothetical protein